MPFSEEALAQLDAEYRTISDKGLRLMQSYLIRDFGNACAKEHAAHGFSRRVKTLARCIENIFSILPPGRNDLPTSEELNDAAINLQAFIFNVFGAFDNLAWIWVCEKDIRTPEDAPLPKEWIGLWKRLVLQSLSPELQGYLGGLSDWLKNLEDFRHALAHRIPLYIPPYRLHPDNEMRYRELDRLMEEAVQAHEFGNYERLEAEQDALGVFTPVMMHSIEGNSKIVVFHAQVLADFNTVEEVGQKILAELDRS